MSSSTRTRRRSLAVLLALPTAGLAAVIALPFLSAPASSCGNPFGCGSVRNAGEQAVTITAFDADDTERAVYAVAPDARDVLLGFRNEIVVPAGSCLVMSAGPFWLDRAVVEAPAEAVRVPVDHWGARVELVPGPCPE